VHSQWEIFCKVGGGISRAIYAGHEKKLLTAKKTLIVFVQMLSLDDPRWTQMNGGYKVPFDPRSLLKRLETDHDIDSVWKELWNELHHQGDVGVASFAAVPHIARVYCKRGVTDWNAYAIIAVIELARNKDGNPDVPEWLKDDYFNAISALAEKGISELPHAQAPETCLSILSVIAFEKGLRNHARLLIDYSDDELGQMEFTWKS
jgi:hypothetical protein